MCAACGRIGSPSASWCRLPGVRSSSRCAFKQLLMLPNGPRQHRWKSPSINKRSCLLFQSHTAVELQDNHRKPSRYLLLSASNEDVLLGFVLQNPRGVDFVAPLQKFPSLLYFLESHPCIFDLAAIFLFISNCFLELWKPRGALSCANSYQSPQDWVWKQQSNHSRPVQWADKVVEVAVTGRCVFRRTVTEHEKPTAKPVCYFLTRWVPTDLLHLSNKNNPKHMIVWCGAKTGINNNQMTFVVKPAGIINYLVIKRTSTEENLSGLLAGLVTLNVNKTGSTLLTDWMQQRKKMQDTFPLGECTFCIHGNSWHFLADSLMGNSSDFTHEAQVRSTNQSVRTGI